MIGLERGTVKVVAYSDDWKRLFEAEKDLLLSAVGVYVLEIEHVGSTSVENLEAKPIIDIAAALENISDIEKCVAPLENLGYVYRGENDIAGRHYFRKGEPSTVHLHVVERNSKFWTSHLQFRDYLRQNPETSREYGKLKLRLAAEFPLDRESYTNGKAAFIERVLRNIK